MQLLHLPSGIKVETQAFRGLADNRKEARKLLRLKLDQVMNGKDSKIAKDIAKIQKRKARNSRRNSNHSSSSSSSASSSSATLVSSLDLRSASSAASASTVGSSCSKSGSDPSGIENSD